MEVELRRGSDEGSRKLVVRFVLHERESDSSGKLSRLILFCLLVSSRSFPKKASCKEDRKIRCRKNAASIEKSWVNGKDIIKKSMFTRNIKTISVPHAFQHGRSFPGFEALPEVATLLILYY